MELIAAYFGKGYDGWEIFDGLKIQQCEQFKKHLNQHNVICMTSVRFRVNVKNYRKYISRIEKRLLADLVREFPDVDIDKEDSLWDVLNGIYELKEEVRFIFVMDEWEYIFHRDFVSDSDKKEYIVF